MGGYHQGMISPLRQMGTQIPTRGISLRSSVFKLRSRGTKLRSSVFKLRSRETKSPRRGQAYEASYSNYEAGKLNCEAPYSNYEARKLNPHEGDKITKQGNLPPHWENTLQHLFPAVFLWQIPDLIPTLNEHGGETIVH
jgi:hypothetical protein